MKAPNFLRHSAWIATADFIDTFHIIGCGAVGSNLALMLAKMGAVDFVLWDSDEVEAHNLPNQAYMPQHIDMKKVDALEAVLKEFNPAIQVTKMDTFFTEEHKDSIQGTVVIATDSMKSRKTIGEVFTLNHRISHVFEIRLGFDAGEFNVIDNMSINDCNRWKAGLMDDKDVPEGPCNRRICTTLVNLVSSYAVHTICAKYAAQSTNDIWEYDRTTKIFLLPTLSVYKMK